MIAQAQIPTYGDTAERESKFFDYFCSRNSHISLQTNKNMPSYYNDNTKMSDIICDAPQLLQMMSRFGIPLGVGDRSVQEICATAGVDTPTFLAVANFMRHGSDSVTQHLDQVSVSALMTYLKMLTTIISVSSCRPSAANFLKQSTQHNKTAWLCSF